MPRVSRVPWAAVLRCACLRVHAKEHGQASTPAQWKSPGPFCIYGRTPRRECLTPGERRVWRFLLGEWHRSSSETSFARRDLGKGSRDAEERTLRRGRGAL